MKNKLIVFDCDGVLRSYSWEAVFQAYEAICSHFRIDFVKFFPSMEAFKAVYSHDWKRNLRYIGITDEKDFPMVNKIFHAVYDPHIAIFHWVEEAMRELSSKATVAVLSNSPTSSITKTLNGSSRHISMLVGSDLMPRMKPDPGGLHMLMDKFKTKPEDTWMIGDSDIDIMTGKSAETGTIAVGWGATESREELLALQADELFCQPKNLVRFLKYRI